MDQRLAFVLLARLARAEGANIRALWRRFGISPKTAWLAAPFRHKTYDPDPQCSTRLGKRGWRIEATFAQLVERSQLKQVWARDLGHVGNR